MKTMNSFFSKSNLKSICKRILPSFFVVTIVISSLSISYYSSAATSGVKNYPLLKYFEEGSAPSSENPWKFGIKDFGEKPAFTDSTVGYRAPVAVWDANDSKANITWEAYTGAVAYTLNIYEGNSLFHTENLANTIWSSGVDGRLQGGNTYEIQVLALDSSNNVLAATAVRTFKAEETPINTTIINDFNSTTQAANLTGFKTVSVKNAQIVAKGNTNKNNGTFKAEGYLKNDTATAIAFYVKAENMAATYEVGFRTDYSSSTNAATKSGTKDTFYIVSAANPNNIMSNTTYDMRTVLGDKSFGDFDGGYYVVIPLSVYNDATLQGIKDGTYSVITLKLDNIYYQDADGKYPSKKQNFDGSEMIVDNFMFVNDVDAFISDLQHEYDRINNPAKYEEYINAKDAETSTVYKNEGTALVYADVFANNTLKNDDIANSYDLTDNANSRQVIFNATSESSIDYGAHLRFTAPEDGIYDLAGILKVTGNNSVTNATINYHILKIASDNTESLIWPNDGSEWISGEITSANLNPVLDFPAAQVKLKNGESIAIESYVHSNDATSAEVKISFGNPTTTIVSEIETYKGKSITYSFGDYVDKVVYDGSLSSKKYQSQSGRWDSVLLLNRDGMVSYSDFTTYNSGWQLLYADGLTDASGGDAKQMGYYYYIPVNKNRQMMLNIGYDGYGTALRFTSPSSGNATVSLPLSSYSGSTLKYRIVKNDTTIYPTDSNWASLPESDATISVDCAVEYGDIIAIEFYSSSSAKENYSLKEAPSVTISQGSNANALADTTFSPLWERPYNEQDYKGEFIAPVGTVWDFALYNISEKSIEMVDHYDTDNKMLYKDGISDAGYVFAPEQLKFKTNSSYGLSLSFVAPTRGYYDLSTALNVLQGRGELYARVMIGEKTVFPETDQWYVTENTNGIFKAIEIGAEAGEKITLQVYAVSAEGSTEPMIIGLGTPIIQRLSNRMFTSTGNTSLYRPTDYIAFEDGYSGEFIQLNSRFKYSINNREVSKTYADLKRLSLDDNNYFSFTSGALTEKIAAGNNAKIEFTSPMTGQGSLQLAATLSTGDVEYKLSADGAVLFDWTATLPETTNISLQKADDLVLEVRSTNGAEITFNTINITLIGQHNNSNLPTDDGFYAAHANPYGDDYYVGEYEKTEVGFWNFNFYDADADKIVNSNYYSSVDKKISYSKVDDLGYYFATNNLTADINVKEQYGLALGFTAPRSDTFNSRIGLRLATSGATAKIAVRVNQISAIDGVTSQIWPIEGSWYTQEISDSQDITIPYAELELEKGDTVYVEIYAIESNSDKLTLNLVSPAFLKEAAASIAEPDIVAKIYRAVDYSPYSHIDGYNGAYVPMENRWNFHFANVSNNGETFELFEADKVRTDLNLDQLYSTKHGELPMYRWSSGTGSILANSFLSASENCGTVMEYIVPATGTLIVSAPVTISEIPVEGASLKYSVVLQNAIDGTETTVWPNNGKDKWETLDNDNTSSNCMDIEANAEIGDKLLFKLYWDVDTDLFKQYLTDNSLTKWSPEYRISPVVTFAEYIDDIRTTFSPSSQFIGTYLVSPYWRVEYSLDSNNPKWLPATVYKWGNWMASGYNDIGINAKCWYWIKNREGSLDNMQPVLAWKFTPKNDGYLSLKDKAAKFVSLSTGENNVEIRITQNGKNVYPTEGWLTVKPDEKVSFKDIGFEVKAKDEIRFELRTVEPIVSGDQVYFEWVPSFTINKYKNIYNMSDDIYNMLDDVTLAMFKAMDGSVEFDENLAANKILSEKIKAEMENLKLNGDNADDDIPTQNISPDDLDDDYTEWTEEIVTPGGRWKKTISRYSTAWWVYVLIAGVGVLVVGVGVVILLILRKKGKIGKKLVKSKVIQEDGIDE